MSPTANKSHLLQFDELNIHTPIIATINHFNEGGKHGVFLSVINTGPFRNDTTPYTLPTAESWDGMGIRNTFVFGKAKILCPFQGKSVDIYCVNVDGQIYDTTFTMGNMFNAEPEGLDIASYEIIKVFHHQHEKFHGRTDFFSKTYKEFTSYSCRHVTLC